MRQLGACALAAAVLLPLAGCGGGSKGQPIPSAQAARIIGRLDEAKRRNDPLRCHDLQRDTIPALKAQVGALPPSTDSDIKQTLSDGIDHLNDLVSQECNTQQVPTQTTTTETTTESTPSTTESTPSTDTTNTETNTNTDTNTNTNTNTDTTGTNGGTPGQGGATSGGKTGGNGGGGK